MWFCGSVVDERMQFDQLSGVEAEYGSESFSNGELEGLHAQNIELSNDKALWKEKARMMEEALHEEAMERSKLQLSLDKAHCRLRLLAREPLMSSSLHTRALPPSAKIGLLKNATPPKHTEDIWDSETELEDYRKRGGNDDNHQYTNGEKVLELEAPNSVTRYWESTEREMEMKADSSGRPADLNNNSIVQEVGNGFQSNTKRQSEPAVPFFKNGAFLTARIEQLECENSELKAQCLALKTLAESAARVQEERKMCCVELETELDFLRCRISSAEKRRDASEEAAQELQEVVTAIEKRVTELQYTLTQRNRRVKELESSLDEASKLFQKSMESSSSKLALSATRADNAEVKASQLEQEKSLAENENLVLKSSLFTWQQKLEACASEAEERAYEAGMKALSISDNEPLNLFENRRLGTKLGEECKNVSRLLKESNDNMERVLAVQNYAIEQDRCIASENIAQAKAQAEENKALRSELDHILDIHSQQAGDMDQRLLHEQQSRQRLEEELKSSRKAYSELEAQVLQRNTLLSSLDRQLDMLTNNTKKCPSSVMEEV